MVLAVVVGLKASEGDAPHGSSPFATPPAAHGLAVRRAALDGIELAWECDELAAADASPAAAAALAAAAAARGEGGGGAEGPGAGEGAGAAASAAGAGGRRHPAKLRAGSERTRSGRAMVGVIGFHFELQMCRVNPVYGPGEWETIYTGHHKGFEVRARA